MFSNLHLTDKVVRRDILQSVTIHENRFCFEPEITAKLVKKAISLYEASVSYHGRTYAEGEKINWKDGGLAIWCSLKYSL